MTNLQQISVNLSEGQKDKLRRAFNNREEVTIRLSNSELTGNDVLFVPAQTVRKLAKHRNLGQGMQIKISQSNIRKQSGSGIFSALLPLAKAALPTVGKTLGLSALSGLASEGASQILKKITGGQIFQVPNANLVKLAAMKHLLTNKQLGDLANAYQLGKDMLFRINQKQVGNGIGMLLGSIGIPLAIDLVKKLSGSGAMHMGRYRGRNSGGNRGSGAMRIGRYRGKKKRSRIDTWKKQSLQFDPDNWRHTLKFHKTIPMSNFDLLAWAKYLKIPLNSVLSRDQDIKHNHKLALFIYNLEPSYMDGSHWTASYIKDNVINYFDSFGMSPFQKIVDHAKKKNLTLLHQNSQLQNLYTSTCGYYVLYFLNEMHKGNRYFDLLQAFNVNDTEFNEKFIEKYFKNLEP